LNIYILDVTVEGRAERPVTVRQSGAPVGANSEDAYWYTYKCEARELKWEGQEKRGLQAAGFGRRPVPIQPSLYHNW